MTALKIKRSGVVSKKDLSFENQEQIFVVE